MGPLGDVWRTEDRLSTDDETIERLLQAAGTDPAISAVVDGLGPGEAGNGSVWSWGVARGDGVEVGLKLGARVAERAWMAGVAEVDPAVVPRIFGSGELHGVGWLVLERCDATLDATSGEDLDRLVAAAARYQRAAADLPLDLPTMDAAWIRDHLVHAAEADCPGPIDVVRENVEADWDLIVRACGLTPTHGDLHPANAVARTAAGPALLIDPMPIRTVWAWDAAYLAANNAPYRPEGTHDLIRRMAAERAALGLGTTDALDVVEPIVLGWAAALWWRIAPWRIDRPAWMPWVAARIEAAARTR